MSNYHPPVYISAAMGGPACQVLVSQPPQAPGKLK